MGTLTVANLLPADLDPESFTGGALQTLLDRLRAESEQVRVALFSHLAQEVSSAGAAQSLSALNVQPTAFPADSVEWEAVTCVKTVTDLQSQVRTLEAKIAVTKALQDLESQVQDFRSNLASGRYREAAWGFLQLKKISEDGRAGAVDTGQGVGSIDSMLEWCGNTLAQQLREDCAALVQASSEHRYLSVRQLTVRGASLAELWSTLALTQQLELHMSPLAEGIISQVVQPLLHSACTVSATQYDASTSSDGTVGGPVAYLQWASVQEQGREDSGAVPHRAASTLEASKQTLDFLVNCLCGSETEAVQVFGQLFWPQFVSSYVKSLVHPLLSHSQPATEAVEQLLSASVQLEQHAASVGLIPAGNNSLSSEVEGLIRGSVHDRRVKYLASARQLLVDNHEIVEVGGPLSAEALILLDLGGEEAQDSLIEGLSSGIFHPGPISACGFYHIPRGIQQLEQLIQDAVIEACSTSSSNSSNNNSSNSISKGSSNSSSNNSHNNSSNDTSNSSSNSNAAANALHDAVEGVLLLVQQLVQRQCGDNCPGQLLLSHCNGLRYLAQSIMMLPVKGGKALNKGSPPGHWSFPSQVLALHRLHNDLLSSLIRAEVASLLELLSPLLQPWRSSSAQADIARRKAVSQFCHSLSRLGKALLTVAPVDTLIRVAAGVLSGVCSRVVAFVLERQDIGAEESKELSSCFKTMMEDGVKGLLQAGQPLSSQLERSGANTSMVREAVLQGASSFRQLLCVCAMLDAKLVQIVEWWEAGRMTGAGLGAGEVQHLVMALFEDNTHRRSCLQRLVS